MKTFTLGALVLAFAGLSAAADKPSPTQPGIIDTCTDYYLVKSGDVCISIVQQFNNAFTLDQFLRWNPAAGSDCKNLLAGYYCCVGAPGTGTTLTTSTTTATTTTKTTSTSTTGITTPTPTQSGMVKNCDRFYFVKPGDTCRGIAPLYNVSEDDLKKWNPMVGSACTNIWANTYLCVHVAEPPLTCNTDSAYKTWGDNKPSAVQAAATWCNDTTAAEGGVYEIAEKRTGCFNAALGQNKFSFEVDNNSGVRAGLPISACKNLLAIPIDGCARGGVGVSGGWRVSASVTAGRC